MNKGAFLGRISMYGLTTSEAMGIIRSPLDPDQGEPKICTQYFKY